MEFQCPKCHFIQPKDQYCARCGVDMQKYKPQNTSVFKKFNLQTSLLFLIAMTVIGLTIFIFRTSDKPLTNTLNQFSSVKSFRGSEKNVFQESLTEVADSGKNQDSASANFKPETVDLKVADESQLDQFAGADSRGQTAGNTKDDFTNPRIKISFIEITHDQLSALLAQSQNEGLLQREGDQFKGFISNISYLAQYRYKTLKQEVKELRPNQIEAFFFGKTPIGSAQFVGLQMNLEKKSFENQETRWVLTANATRGESKETEAHEFTMNKNAAFFMNAKNWLNGFENERFLSDTPPFSALSSSDFLNQRSEIIILLENY